MSRIITASVSVMDKSAYTHSICTTQTDTITHIEDGKVSITDHGIMVYGRRGTLGVDLHAVSRVDFTKEDGYIYEAGAFVADDDNAYRIEFARCRVLVHIVVDDQLWKWDSWGNVTLGEFLTQLKAVFG